MNGGVWGVNAVQCVNSSAQSTNACPHLRRRLPRPDMIPIVRFPDPNHRTCRVVGLGCAGIIYGGCRLAGSFVYFWLMLMSTLSNGIGEWLLSLVSDRIDEWLQGGPSDSGSKGGHQTVSQPVSEMILDLIRIHCVALVGVVETLRPTLPRQHLYRPVCTSQ